MMKFRTQYNNDVKPLSNSGSYLRPVYHLEYDEHGTETLVQIGVHDQYKEIQSYRDGCDLAMILSRLDKASVNGMMSTYQFDDILSGEVLDVFDFPKNPGEMLNLAKKGEQLFQGLPVEVREAFDFNSRNFISSFGTQRFADKMNELAKMYSKASIPDDDVVVKQGRKFVVNPDVNLKKGGASDGEE